MSQPKATVVIPTLSAGPSLLECLGSLARQSRKEFDVIIVDNSGKGLVRLSEAGRLGATVLETVDNLGFGAALNEGIRNSQAPYIATLNDDAVAHPDWLAALIEALDERQDVGSCASQVRLMGQDRLDSAGMLIAADGTSKQRGHGEPPSKFYKREEVLCPSGSAAIYRRKMVERVGLFDGDFFLYCEDTDLGLRAQWAGWKCLYVPDAVAEHEYSRTAGKASPLKAYYVERNRLMLAAKNFPAPELLKMPASTVARYFWHSFEAMSGHGTAGRFQASGGGGVLQMGYIAARAHLAAAWHLGRIWKKRREIRYFARITPEQFREVLRKYSITPRQVAAQ